MDRRVKDLMGYMMYDIFDSINNADIITKDGGFIVKLPDGSEYLLGQPASVIGGLYICIMRAASTGQKRPAE